MQGNNKITVDGNEAAASVAFRLSGLLIECFISQSAKGAKYESQGQAVSEAKRVAPGIEKID